MNNKITFPDLVQLVAESTNTSQRMSELFLKELFATISQALMAGEEVTIKNLGTFGFAKVSARQSVSVHSGERIEIPSHEKLVFTPAKALADAINKPFAAFEAIELSDEMSDEMLQRIDQGNSADTEELPQVHEQTTDEYPTPESEIDNDKPEVPVAQPLMPPPFDSGSQEPELEQETEDEIEAEPSAALGFAAPAQTEVTPSDVENNAANIESGTEADNTLVEHIEQAKGGIARQSFIKGLLTGIAATLLLAGIVWVAWNSGRNSALADIQPDTTQHAATSDTPPPPAEVKDEKAAEPMVTDTCSTTMYLSKMSQKHYGKPDFWIYIYEENKDKIADPNNVPPGTVVIVPPADKYGIDPNDKSSIDRARTHTYKVLTSSD